MKKKILTKDQILRAMKYTKSNMAAARFLGCSYPHYKQYAKLYKNEDGKTLFEVHLNRQGKGISKHLYKKKDITPIMDILEGRVDVSNYSPKELKERLIHEALIKEECNRCGFNERRVVDYKVPLILNFKDGNKKNWKLENLELLCYNCYFLTVGDIFNDKQIKGLEDHKPVNNSEVDWELDDYQKQRLEELGLGDEPEDDYISRI